MDVTKFTGSKTGALLPISTPTPDHAFVPYPLPPTWQFDIELWPLLAEAKRCLGLLDGVATTLPNPQLFLRPLQRIESLTSSRLEGTYATAQELILFEMSPKESVNPSDESHAWNEVHNYSQALSYGVLKLSDSNTPFSLQLLRELHRTLLSGFRGTLRNPGEFRNHQVHIGSTRRYVPPPPDQVLPCLGDLEKYFISEDSAFDPLVRCFIAHYQLEAIHPFSDGNGRIGRVVLSLMIYKWCNLKMPWLYLSPFFERYKDEYIEYMFKVSTEGAWRTWIEFCLRGVIEQAEKAAQTCDALHRLKQQMHDRVNTDGGTRIHAIIENLFDWPIVRVAELAKRNNVRYPTAKTDVKFLEEKGVLRLLPEMKVSTYYSPEIFEIAYSEQ